MTILIVVDDPVGAQSVVRCVDLARSACILGSYVSPLVSVACVVGRFGFPSSELSGKPGCLCVLSSGLVSGGDGVVAVLFIGEHDPPAAAGRSSA